MCDVTTAPFPRRIPPVKSFISVLNKSLIQVVTSSGATTSKTVRDEDADSEWWGLAVRFDRTSRARPKMAAQGQFPLPSVRHSSSYDAVCALVEMSHNVSAPARRSGCCR